MIVHICINGHTMPGSRTACKLCNPRPAIELKPKPQQPELEDDGLEGA